MKVTKHVGASVVAAVAVALGLAACGESNDSRTAGQKVDSAVAQVERDWEQAKGAVKDTVTRAPTPSAVSDTTITSAVKAELAKDSQLGALKIDVETANGRVSLKGAAPSAVVRDHATQVALAVKGVAGVDNLLTVGTS